MRAGVRARWQKSGGQRIARPTHCTDCLWELVLVPRSSREDQSARRRLERPGRSRSPFLIESFRLGKEDASSTGHGRSGTSMPRNLCAAVKLRKGIRPVLQTGLIVEK